METRHPAPAQEGSHHLPPLLWSIDDEHPTGFGPHPPLGPPDPLIPRHVGLVGPDLGRLIGSRHPSGGTPLAGWRLAEPLPQERLAAVGQPPVRALDLPEELGQVLVAGVLGVLEVDRARVRPLQDVIEDANNVIMLIPGACHVFARGHLPLLSEAWAPASTLLPPSLAMITLVLPDAGPLQGSHVRPADRHGQALLAHHTR